MNSKFVQQIRIKLDEIAGDVELYPDAFGNPKLISDTATDEVKQRIANRIGKTVQAAGFSR